MTITGNDIATVQGPSRAGINRRPATGIAAIALAVAFNTPFAILASTFDYPDVLRRPAGEVLDLFAAGGPALVLTWHAFALTALALAPMAIVLSLTPARIAARPGLTIGAAVTGALAGLAQAIGLWRWVFVVPGLSRAHGEGSPETQRAAERTFDLINQYGGVAIGEHLGQTLTALFVLMLSLLQLGERMRVTAGIGLLAAATIAIGTGEGLSIAIGQSGEMFASATVLGFMGLSAWLIATGFGLLRGVR